MSLGRYLCLAMDMATSPEGTFVRILAAGTPHRVSLFLSCLCLACMPDTHMREKMGSWEKVEI